MLAIRQSFICALALAASSAASSYLPASYHPITPAYADEQSKVADLGELFQALPGRWVGEGRIVSRNKKIEKVKCRVTYFLSDDKSQLRQNIRCASAGGKMEIKSIIKRDGDAISGTWHETIYELKGELTGRAIRNGLMVQVKGDNSNATMQLFFVKGKQVAEIHFHSGTLLGITLVLHKG